MTGAVSFEQGAPAAPPTTVPAMVARQCARRPAAPAVETDEQVLNYQQLAVRADALAARLRPLAGGGAATSAGSGAGQVVALLLDRGPEFVVAMLAAWRAGYAFSPIDPGYPAARIGYLLEDLAACALVTGGAARAAVPAGATMPIVDVDEPGPATGPGTDPEPDATAYVLYTSGTTGTPKGVAISHRGLAQLAGWCVEATGFRPDDRASQLASVGFDAAQLETWPALTAGACLLPYQRPVRAGELPAWLDRRRVTRSFLVTPLAEAVWSLAQPLPHLRTLLVGGAALARRPPADLGYPVWNLYGPTECTILATAELLSHVDGPLNVIGRPIAGASVFVLDEEGERCPVGEPGEIHIGGTGVAPGYWRRPALTQQRFASTDPDGQPGPVYRTGDQGRWLPDGRLEFLGRVDRQLEVRGHRIEPGEVETRLRADPLVADAHVLAVSTGPAGRLVAYLVPRPGAERDTVAVVGRASEWLADHLLPDAVVWLTELPRTAHGKLDEARLPAAGQHDPATRADFAEPAGDLERRVAAVWSRVLGVDRVGRHDAFFDLGGSSLLLVSLRAELQAELGVPIPMPQLFEHSTVHALARWLAGPADGEPARSEARDRARAAQRARAARATRRS